jgi:hypothetical protein
LQLLLPCVPLLTQQPPQYQLQRQHHLQQVQLRLLAQDCAQVMHPTLAVLLSWLPRRLLLPLV